MATTYRYCEVDPETWVDRSVIEDVKEAEITYDSTLATKGTMTMKAACDVGETYIRAYLIRDKAAPVAIGTFLAQTSKSKHDGRTKLYDIEAYTPLHELAETYPPIGYFIPANTRIATKAAQMAAANCRAPITPFPDSGAKSDPCVAATDETWLDFISEVLSQDSKWLLPDYDGSIVIASERDAESMQPVFEFNDGNASIVQADIEEVRDLYKVPNKVHVIADNGKQYIATNENDDTLLSYNNRGRWVEVRITDPKLPEGFTDEQLKNYTERELAKRSLVEHEVTFTHEWVPNLHIGDCVRIDFKRAGKNAKAVIESMTLKCDKDALVKTKVIYTEVMA